MRFGFEVAVNAPTPANVGRERHVGPTEFLFLIADPQAPRSRNLGQLEINTFKKAVSRARLTSYPYNGTVR